MKDFSIVVCTRNPRAKFADTLKALTALDCNDLRVEVILVDNKSDFDVQKIFASSLLRLRDKFEVNVQYQAKAGLAFARQLGLQQATGDYVVFCDDDNLLEYDFLQVANSLMMALPDVGALGGKSCLPYETELKDRDLQMFAVGRQQDFSGYHNKNYLWGAALVVRRHVATLATHQFDPLCVGRTHENTETGDDGELCLYIKCLGYKLYYSNDLNFTHNISQSRITDLSIQKMRLEFRTQVNFRILSFVYDLFYNKKFHPNSLFYLSKRPKCIFEAFKRIKHLKKLRIPQ